MTRLKEFRLSHNCSGADLARASGMARQNLGRIEEGKRPLTLKQGKKLIIGYAKLGIDASDVVIEILFDDEEAE